MAESNKRKRNKEMDMLNGGLAGKLILFAVPLAFSSILQQLFNSADVAVVGRFVGDSALAAVGSGVAVVGFYVNLLTGLAVGPNAVLATLIGQNKRERISATMHTSVSAGALIGIGLMLIGMFFVRMVLVVSGTPAEVLDDAVLYMRIYFIGVPFMMIYNFGASILRSYGDTKRPMYYLLISGAVNVVLNLFFVIVCHLGVSGVAIATTISNILSTVMVLAHLYRKEDEFQFRFRRLRIDWKILKRVLAIGVPAGLQGAIFSVSNMFIQSGINSFGADAIAGSSIGVNFEYFTYDIAAAFGQAAVTFTSQNYGAGYIKRCKKIFWLCMLFGFGFTEILSIIFTIWGNFFVGIYTTSSAVAAFALLRMHRIASWEGVTATYEVESAALRGMGKSVSPSVVIVLGTVVLRMLWMVTIFQKVHTYTMLMDVYLVSWIFTGGVIFVIYMRHMKKQSVQ